MTDAAGTPDRDATAPADAGDEALAEDAVTDGDEQGAGAPSGSALGDDDVTES